MKDAVKEEIKRRDNYECFFCETHNNLTCAHIFVWKKDGGMMKAENLMCICRQCHDAMDFGIGVTREEQIKMLELCKMYLTLYYNREIDMKTLSKKRKG